MTRQPQRALGGLRNDETSIPGRPGSRRRPGSRGTGEARRARRAVEPLTMVRQPQRAPQLEPIDTSEIEALLEQARIKVETLVPLDAHHLLGFVQTEIEVALDGLRIRKRFEDSDRFK